MAKDRHPHDDKIKVTDKRMFTSEGEIKDEYLDQVNPVEPFVRAVSPPEPPPAAPREAARAADPKPGDGGKKLRDRGANPGTPFTNFIESLIVNAYMSLGMLPNPYGEPAKPDLVAARQMIDIVVMIEEKTKGNLTEEESDFLSAHLGSLKLEFVRRSKAL